MGRAPSSEKNGLKKGPWTAEEDTKLTTYIQLHGPGNWKFIPKNAGLQRCGKSCRLRWTNYLRPDIKRGKFSFEEEETIIQLHSVLGNKWSCIAVRLPGRTDNEIKNYWNTHIRKRLLRNGIDPVTHAPRLDLLNLFNAPQINLSNLIYINQALQNPQLLTLALNIESLYNNLNTDVLLQKLQSGYQAPPVVQPNQFENSNIINQQINPGFQNPTHESTEGYNEYYDINSTGQMSTSHEYCYVPNYGTSDDHTNGSMQVEGKSFCSSMPIFEIEDDFDLENFM